MCTTKYQLFVQCCNHDLALRLDDKKVDFVVIGLYGYSTRFNGSFDLEEITALYKALKFSKLCVYLNNLYTKTDLDNLVPLLKTLSEIGIKHLMFESDAIEKLVKVNKLDFELIKATQDINDVIYETNEVNSYNLLQLKNKEQINDLTKTQKEKTILKIFGLVLINTSYINHFSQFENLESIKQHNFNSFNYFYNQSSDCLEKILWFKDTFGNTNLTTGLYLNAIANLNWFRTNGINRFVIDSFFMHDDDLALDKVVDFYLKALNTNLTDAELIKFEQEINKLGEFNSSLMFLK